MKGEIDLLVDDILKVSRQISLTEEINDQPLILGLSEERKTRVKKAIFNLNAFFSPYLSAIKDIHNHRPANWYGDLFDKKHNFTLNPEAYLGFNSFLWQKLPIISDINYVVAPDIEVFINDSVERVKGGVNYSTNNMWEIDFLILNNFIDQFEGRPIELENCIALYIIHEAFHKEHHKLDRYTVEGIGDFSRVIEEADYQADVYAIINLLIYRLRNLDNKKGLERVLDLAIGLVNTALDTTYAFAKMEGRPPYKRSQIRRVNRTLIWVYQLLKLEEAKKNPYEQHFKNILDILSQKPILDVSGLEIFTTKNRTYFKLDIERADKIEIATFKDNSIYRNEPNQIGFQKMFIEGLQNLDKIKLKEALTSYLTKARIL